MGHGVGQFLDLLGEALLSRSRARSRCTEGQKSTITSGTTGKMEEDCHRDSVFFYSHALSSAAPDRCLRIPTERLSCMKIARHLHLKDRFARVAAEKDNLSSMFTAMQSASVRPRPVPFCFPSLTKGSKRLLRMFSETPAPLSITHRMTC